MSREKQQRQPGHSVPTYLSEVGTRIQKVAKLIGTLKSAASAGGISDDQLANYIKGKAKPSFPVLSAMCRAAGISLDWLATGKEPMYILANSISSKPADDLGPGFVLVPRYDIAASAGPGALADREHVVDFLAFQESWVRRTLRVDPAKLALVTAVGDSMEPTIRAGDLLLVDTGVQDFIDDAIYVMSLDGHLVVKRIQRFFGGAVSVKSDNERSYVDQTLTAEESSQVSIAGRVRWIGRLI